MKMDILLNALGAQAVPYPCKVRCCGGMLMTTEEDVALSLNLKLLQAAVENGADVIATACPLCQMNLEAYQDKINRRFGRNYNIPVVYFSHLLGTALGINSKQMGMDKLLIAPTMLEDAAKEVRA
jgi:heterodisulfide reductase subunit B2